MPDASLAGRILVASPALSDPNFDRALVLVLQHDEDGAIGVILNRVGDSPLAELLWEWAPLAAPPAFVFHGGPVATQSAVCLASGRGTNDDGSPDWRPLFDGLGTLNVDRSPDGIDVDVDAIRLFVGYSGWGEGQLEAEIAAGAWFVVDARPDDVFCSEPGGLWRTVLRRQRGGLALLANYPEDVSLN